MEKSQVMHVTPEHRRAAKALALSRGLPIRAWIAGLSFLIVLLAWSLAAQARAAPESFADLAERLLPTVVNIATTQTIETRRGEEFDSSKSAASRAGAFSGRFAPRAPRPSPAGPITKILATFRFARAP